MKRLSSLTLALTCVLAAPAFAADEPTTNNNDLRELDVLVVTGATLDGNTQRWADQANDAAATGANDDIREMDAILVTGATGDGQRWAED